jgi:DNA-binding MarR family transcriptional regulator
LDALGESIFVWRLLAYLHDDGPSIQAELADATAQHPASVSRLLDEMEEAGLVVRRRDGVDRRRVRVELTAAGDAKYDSLYDEALSVLEESLSHLSEAEQRELAQLLTKMIDAQKPPRRRG